MVWSDSSSTTPLFSLVGMPSARSAGSSVWTMGPVGPSSGPEGISTVSVARAPARAYVASP